MFILLSVGQMHEDYKYRYTEYTYQTNGSWLNVLPFVLIKEGKYLSWQCKVI